MSNKNDDVQFTQAMDDFEPPALSDDFYPDLRSKLKSSDSKKVRRFPVRSVGLRVLAVAASITVIASVSSVVLRDHNKFVEPASAAEVIDRSLDALSSMKTVSGRSEIKSSYFGYEGCSEDSRNANKTADGGFMCGDGQAHQHDDSAGYNLILNADGSYRAELDSPEGKHSQAYDAETGIATGYGDGMVYALSMSDVLSEPDKSRNEVDGFRITGVIPAGPDANISLDRMGLPETANALVSLKQQKQLSLKPINYEGRPAYEIGSEDAKAVFGSEGNLRMVVDKATLFPVLWELTGHPEIPGKLSYEMHDLKVNSDVPRSSFTVNIPESVPVTTADQGGRPVQLRSAAPKWIPKGYKLSSTTHVDGKLDTQHNVTVFVYRNGFQSIVVTTRDAGAADTDWREKTIFHSYTEEQPQQRTLASGAFKSVPVEIYAGLDAGQAHLWGKTDKQVLTVQGDVSVDQLIRIAESMP